MVGQVPALGEHFRVIRYDLRGFGRSEDPKRPYQNRVDLEALLDALEIPTAFIVGLSRGGRVALEFAVHNPRRVSRLVLIGTALRFKEQPLSATDSTLPFIEDVANLLDEGKTTGKALDRWLKAPIWQSAKSGVLDEIREIVTDYFRQRIASDCFRKHKWGTSNRQTDLVRSDLSGINIPMLVLVGEHDGDDFHESADFLRQHVPSCDHRIVPKARHLANLDNADFVNRAIVAFLHNKRVQIGGQTQPSRQLASVENEEDIVEMSMRRAPECRVKRSIPVHRREEPELQPANVCFQFGNGLRSCWRNCVIRSRIMEWRLCNVSSSWRGRPRKLCFHANVKPRVQSSACCASGVCGIWGELCFHFPLRIRS